MAKPVTIMAAMGTAIRTATITGIPIARRPVMRMAE